MRIVINGGTGGIGLEIVRKLASDSNNLIVATGRNTSRIDDLLQQFGNIYPLAVDMSCFPEYANIYTEFIENKLGTVDILVNLSGMLVKNDFLEISYSDSKLMMEVNFFGPALSVKAAYPMMHRGTHIVNISSIGGFQGSSKYKGLAYYSSSKAALACLSECLAEEFRESGIVVNCLALGSVNTDMLAQAFPGYKAPLSASEMGEFIVDFALKGHKVFNGKILPVSITNP